MKIAIGTCLGFIIGAIIGFSEGNKTYSSSWWRGYDRAVALMAEQMAEQAKHNPQGAIECVTINEAKP